METLTKSKTNLQSELDELFARKPKDLELPAITHMTRNINDRMSEIALKHKNNILSMLDTIGELVRKASTIPLVQFNDTDQLASLSTEELVKMADSHKVSVPVDVGLTLQQVTTSTIGLIQAATDGKIDTQFDGKIDRQLVTNLVVLLINWSLEGNEKNYYVWSVLEGIMKGLFKESLAEMDVLLKADLRHLILQIINAVHSIIMPSQAPNEPYQLSNVTTSEPWYKRKPVEWSGGVRGKTRQQRHKGVRRTKRATRSY